MIRAALFSAMALYLVGVTIYMNGLLDGEEKMRTKALVAFNNADFIGQIQAGR